MKAMQYEGMNLEEASKAYPDVPMAILVKTEALVRGVKLSQAALQAIQALPIDSTEYNLFGQPVGGEPVKGQKIPSYAYLVKDYTTWRFRTTPNTPYLIDFVDGKFLFYDVRLGTTPLEQVYFVSALKTLAKTLPDGTPYNRIAPRRGIDALFLFLIYYCEFWKDGNGCLFCDSSANLAYEEGRGTFRKHVPPKVTARVTKEIFDNEPEIRHLSINGGSILDDKKELDFYCSYLEALNEAFNGVWYPTWLQIVPRKEEGLKRLHDTGVPCVQFNLEVWDERLFNIICPGKAKLLGRDEWMKRTMKAVDIFGRGNVQSNFVTGVEMAQPWGFKDARSAVKSTLEGFEFLMAHDVQPRMDAWCVRAGSALRDQKPAPLEYYIEVQRGYLELEEKYNFTPFWPGNCRVCSGVDTLDDWWYYFHKEKPVFPKA